MENEGDASEWELRHDETSGQAYYVNLLTGESSWEAPGLSALPSDGSTSVHRQWTEAHDETGRVYFVNLETMETSWDPPPGMYSAVSARGIGVPGAVEDTLMRRPSTAEQMEQLNALLSGGDGDDGDEEDAEEPAQSVAVASAAVHVEEDAAVVPQAGDGSEWMMFLNETDGIPYYYNHITGECEWEPPAAFLEYHLNHSEADHSSESHDGEHDVNGEPTDLRVITTPAPHPPMSPPPASPTAQTTPVAITPEFEEKVRRAIETVSKTPVGSSRLLFVRTPTVKSIEGVSSARSGSRPTSSSGRSASRPSSSTGTAMQRVTTARALIEGGQITADEGSTEALATDEGVMESGDVVLTEGSDIVPVSEDPVVAQEGDTPEDTNEELDMELQRRDEMMQELMFDEAALVMQCVIRCFVARRRVAHKRQERQQAIDVASREGAIVEYPEPEQNATDQEAANQETLLSGAVELSHDPELNCADLSVGPDDEVLAQDHDADAVDVEDSSTMPDATVKSQEDSAPPEASLAETESPAPEDEIPTVDNLEVMVDPTTEFQETQVEGDDVVLAEVKSHVVVETDEREAASAETDTVAPQLEPDAEGVAHDQDPVDVDASAIPPTSEPEVLVAEAAVVSPDSLLADSVQSEEDKRDAAKQPDYVEAEAETGDSITRDSGVEQEQPAIEELSTLPEATLAEIQPISDAVDVVPTIGSEAQLAQASRDASAEKTPEPTRRSARQAVKSGRRTERARPPSASPTCEQHKSTVNTSSGRLAVLNIMSFFPVRAPRERRDPSKIPAKTPLQANSGIIRKPVPTQSASVAPAVKTDEQRQQERLTRSAVKEKERQDASARWKQQVAQYQQVFADSAARFSAERQRVLEADTQRHQAAALDKRDQLTKETEAKSSDTNQHTYSLWEAADSFRKDDAVDQIRALQTAASEPEGFVDMMMQERLRTLKATAKRLKREGNQDKAEYWQQRVQSFPSSAAEIETCQDAYWTRLHSKLQSLVSSSSAQELTQQLAKLDSLDSLLHMAAWHGNAPVVELLVSDLGFDVNAADNSVAKATALHEASRGGHVDVVECLLARGAHLDAIDAHGDTPLHVASRMGHSQVVHRLIAAGETHQDHEDPHSSVHAPGLRSLSWVQCVHWRNHKQRRAVDVATLPSLKEFLTQYSSENQPETDAVHTNHGAHSRGSSAASTAVKHSKLAVKKKKITSARPKSAAKVSSMSMGTAAAALAVHAR